MNYAVKMTATAKQDLREIAIWIAESSGDPGVSAEFIEGIKKECEKLRRFPNIGAIPHDRILSSLEYRFLIYKDYLIFYQIDDESKTVNIMAVFNSKKDYLRVMKKFI